MKKLILPVLAVMITFSACKKSSDDAPVPAIGPVPSSFTKKSMLEEFTGTWCGYCPRGATEMLKIDSLKGERFVPVSIHANSGDPMINPTGQAISDKFNDYGFPGGMIDRVTNGSSPTMATNSWNSKVTASLAQTAQAGLAIDASAVTDDEATITVHAGFLSALTGSYTLTVYVVEGTVQSTLSSYGQHNYMGQGCSSPDPSSPWYTYPCTINNFPHRHVLRKVLTGTNVMGEAIPADKVAAGQEYVNTYTLTGLSSMDSGDLYIVAFIDKTASTNTGHQIMNVQEVKLGSIKDWD